MIIEEEVIEKHPLDQVIMLLTETPLQVILQTCMQLKPLVVQVQPYQTTTSMYPDLQQ